MNRKKSKTCTTVNMIDGTRSTCDGNPPSITGPLTAAEYSAATEEEDIVDELMMF